MMLEVTVPPELAWVVPVIVPFIIGLLVGFIVKRTIKLILAIMLLVIILIITGYVSITFQDIYDKAMRLLPKVIDLGSSFINVLPYSSLTFILGLLLGLWKG